MRPNHQFTPTLGILLLLVTGGASIAVEETIFAQPVATDLSDELGGSSKPFLVEGRLEPSKSTGFFQIPKGWRLVITDIVIQNRSAGDEPVSEFAFSRVNFGPFEQDLVQEVGDIVFTAYGNQTTNLHFRTGMVAAPPQFRMTNAPNSTAVFCSVVVSGYLTREHRKD